VLDRLFTSKKTNSKVPLLEQPVIEEAWAVSSPASVTDDHFVANQSCPTSGTPPPCKTSWRCPTCTPEPDVAAPDPAPTPLASSQDVEAAAAAARAHAHTADDNWLCRLRVVMVTIRTVGWLRFTHTSCDTPGGADVDDGRGAGICRPCATSLAARSRHALVSQSGW
jgi:hypothetical protein